MNARAQKFFVKLTLRNETHLTGFSRVYERVTGLGIAVIERYISRRTFSVFLNNVHIREHDKFSCRRIFVQRGKRAEANKALKIFMEFLWDRAVFSGPNEDARNALANAHRSLSMVIWR